jgi:hypothetical protein
MTKSTPRAAACHRSRFSRSLCRFDHRSHSPDRGYELTFAEPKAETAMIEAYGVPLFDHLIVFAPEAGGE